MKRSCHNQDKMCSYAFMRHLTIEANFPSFLSGCPSAANHRKCPLDERHRLLDSETSFMTHCRVSGSFLFGHTSLSVFVCLRFTLFTHLTLLSCRVNCSIAPLSRLEAGCYGLWTTKHITCSRGSRWTRTLGGPWKQATK